jgi:hypothetical protein
MDDAEELARRYFALWAEYLAALVADPQAAEMLQRWVAVASQFTKAAGEPAGSSFPAWPPIPADSRSPSDRPKVSPASATGASGERGDAVGELTCRVGELERRLAALERRPRTRRPRQGNRADGS